MPKNCSNPMCNFKFDRRNPPHVCPKCNVLLGPVKPTKVKENRKPKKTVKVKNPKHVTVDLDDGLYSVQYHQHNRFLYFVLKAVFKYFAIKTCTLLGVL